ncbi:disulfide reductase DsbM [Comamonas humi]
MTSNTLHYIYDPLCGWCYAAAPLVAAVQQLPGLRIALHGGGMMTGERRRRITPDWRGYVLPHDRRIAQMTDQVFGPGYTDGLLSDTTAWLDSAPPTTAILAAEQLAGQGLAMLQRLQKAHYVQGRRIADLPVLQSLAAELGLPEAGFAQAYAQLEGAPTEAHFVQSRRLLEMAGGQGFPTLALQTAPDAPLQPIDLSGWLGKPEAFAAALASALPAARPD